MTEVVIIDGVRTPIGRFGGGLSSVRPDDLLAHTYEALVARTQVLDLTITGGQADPEADHEALADTLNYPHVRLAKSPA